MYKNYHLFWKHKNSAGMLMMTLITSLSVAFIQSTSLQVPSADRIQNWWDLGEGAKGHGTAEAQQLAELFARGDANGSGKPAWPNEQSKARRMEIEIKQQHDKDTMA